jgi:hypothetical protein
MPLLSCVSAMFCKFVIIFGRMWSFNVITVLYFVLLRRFKIRSQVAGFSSALYGGRSPWPFA